jgi:hypothetical protein
MMNITHEKKTKVLYTEESYCNQFIEFEDKNYVYNCKTPLSL